MAARPSSRHRSIPVSVTVERRSKVRPAAVSPKLSSGQRETPHASAPLQPWDDRRRRRMMWFVVGGGALTVIIGWTMIFSAQLHGTSPTFFGDVSRLIRNVQWPWEPQPMSPEEQEIRELEKKVFPQFQ